MSNHTLSLTQNPAYFPVPERTLKLLSFGRFTGEWIIRIAIASIPLWGAYISAMMFLEFVSGILFWAYLTAAPWELYLHAFKWLLALIICLSAAATACKITNIIMPSADRIMAKLVILISIASVPSWGAVKFSILFWEATLLDDHSSPLLAALAFILGQTICLYIGALVLRGSGLVTVYLLVGALLIQLPVLIMAIFSIAMIVGIFLIIMQVELLIVIIACAASFHFLLWVEGEYS